MDGNPTGLEGESLSGADSGARPPRLSPPVSEVPPSVQSALREVRPDDLDAIFDGALFGPSALESSAEAAEAAEAGARDAAPVPVGAMDWYLERDSQLAGPFRLERLRELWHQGALNPDTLFWCEAWTMWRPLSRVPELVAAMTISGLPTVAADASVSPAPARERGAGSGKKVVPALHSLVAEEEGWMRKMQEEKEQAEAEAERAALLDAPGGPAVAPVPPEVAPAPSRSGKTFLAGALIGAAAVGLVVGAMLLLPQARLPGAPAKASPQPVLASVEAPKQSALAVSQAFTPASAPVAAVAPLVRPPAPVAHPAAPAQPKPVVVASAAPVEQKERAGRRVAASPDVSEERHARAAGPAQQHRQRPPPAPVAPAAIHTAGHKALADDTPAEDPTNFEDSLDKQFEKELGFAKDSPKYKPEDPRSKRSVYIPPEPGKDLPESLSTSALVRVVGAHKEAILSCIEAHEPPRTSGSGKDRFVVRWRVLPTGDAVDALMETESLRGTPFARCIEGQVRSWKFPRHRVQSREPVRFPFTY